MQHIITYAIMALMFYFLPEVTRTPISTVIRGATTAVRVKIGACVSGMENEKRAPEWDPIERVSEIIFGLIMARTFTGSLIAASVRARIGIDGLRR